MVEKETSDIEALNILGEKILTASKNELLLSMQFLDIALEQLDYKMDLCTESVGTDGSSIIFNPKFIAENYCKDRAFLNRAYLHILLHCLFRHTSNGKRKNIKYWDLSCDIATEYVIDTINKGCFFKKLSSDREFTYKKLKNNMRELTAERIYEYIYGLGVSGEEFERLACEFKVDSHKRWAGNLKSDKSDDSQESDEENNENNNENSDGQNKSTQDEGDFVSSQGNSGKNTESPQKDWEKTAQRVVENIKKTKENSDNSQSLSKMLLMGKKSDFDYKSFLNKFAIYDEIMKIDNDSFDYGFYNYGFTLYKNMPLIEPLEYKEAKKVKSFVIALDTSASCDEGKIRTFLTETFNILKERETFFDKVDIYILECDNKIQKYIQISDIKEIDSFISELEIKGGGGTDFRPVFAFINNLIKDNKLLNPKGLIYFTDGQGIYPSSQPSFDTAFIFINEEPPEDVPKWAYSLTITDEDLR